MNMVIGPEREREVDRVYRSDRAFDVESAIDVGNTIGADTFLTWTDGLHHRAEPSTRDADHHAMSDMSRDHRYADPV